MFFAHKSWVIIFLIYFYIDCFRLTVYLISFPLFTVIFLDMVVKPVETEGVADNLDYCSTDETLAARVGSAHK